MIHRDDTLTQKDNQRFIASAMAVPMLEREEEHDLAVAWRDRHDEKALHKLINAYTRLVVSMATRFRGYGLPMGDLIQEGHVGLLQAASRFEPERNLRFATYAGWWIRASMQDYILRNWSIVRLSSAAQQKALFFNLRSLKARIEGRQQHLDAGLNDEVRDEIAKAMRVNPSEVERMNQRLSGHDVSLHTPVNDDSGTASWQDFLEDDSISPEEDVMERLDGEVRHTQLQEAMRGLDARERTIIRARHLREQGATLEELGEKLHVSKERVRQLESRALSKLKKAMQDAASSARVPVAA
ncbi:MAG TPA: RNA polymerase factor sigma-32 [Alphaproteobacteria bacterium]|nr:RNA polymerase factor sigma-32 [Alphaproteobacteria bacterium]